ncbi:MAG: FAD:protein FMN transferase, partial [Planctomycetaceae bacterium]
MPEEPSSSRREFLSGQALRTQAAQAGEILADALAEPPPPPTAPVAGDTVRLQTTAMACDFAVIMNPDRGEQIPGASDALQRVHELESQMTVYREGGELAEINRRAFAGPVPVEAQLFELLTRAKRLAEQTGGAFDPTSGPLIALWRHCRAEGRVPSADELDTVRRRLGIEQVAFDEAATSVRFLRDGVELNLGGIGKGYALDRIAAELESAGFTDFLIHGGHSSLLARGRHSGCDGWPVGIRNPLFPQQQFATVLMRGGGLSTSGSGVQSFRHSGKRYGHILDPRTGVPATGMLSVSVIAPTAADADALSTAFFVMGLEKTRDYCDNRPEIG